jgi:hypothetical protein
MWIFPGAQPDLAQRLGGALQRGTVRHQAGQSSPTLTPYGLFNGKNGQSIIIAAVGKKIGRVCATVNGTA